MDGTWNREREREARKRGGGWIGYGRMDGYEEIDGWMYRSI